MQTYICLLRAVNVGGTGKLSMADLRSMASEAGYSGSRTYIQSGNLVLRSEQTKDRVRETLENLLRAYAGKPVGVFVRSRDELSDVLARNPFPKAAPNQVIVVFLHGAPQTGLLTGAKGHRNEKLLPGKSEVFVHYPDGMGKSKLRAPSLADGTARNLNTVAKLVDMASKDA